jgi:hypothetical protein
MGYFRENDRPHFTVRRETHGKVAGCTKQAGAKYFVTDFILTWQFGRCLDARERSNELERVIGCKHMCPQRIELDVEKNKQELPRYIPMHSFHLP